MQRLSQKAIYVLVGFILFLMIFYVVQRIDRSPFWQEEQPEFHQPPTCPRDAPPPMISDHYEKALKHRHDKLMAARKRRWLRDSITDLVLIGLILFLLWVLLRGSKNTQKRCSYCHVPVKKDYHYCPFCGNAINKE